MTNILIVYDTQSGHTKKMAELVRDGAAAVPATDIRLRHVSQATTADLLWCDRSAPAGI